MSEEDYKDLPIEELLQQKLWKARQFGYNQIKELAESNIENEAIVALVSNAEKLKTLVADSNVLSQESGIDAFLTILKKSEPGLCARTRDLIVPTLVEKGLTSSRPNSKKYSTESLLVYIERDAPGKILELMIPTLSVKSPKQVVATIKAVNEIYKEFGCAVIDPKLMIDHIPKMFGNSDKNVRAEATTLSVTLRSYIGDAFDQVIYPKLKPIQQKDLTALFNKIEPGIKPSRLIYTEQLKLTAKNNRHSVADDADVEMTETLEVVEQKPEFDPYELEDPVEVLSKLPPDLSTRVSSSSWKERIEVLQEIAPLFKVVKIENDDYSYFVSLMVGCLRDVNLQVVTLACGILIDLANGLKSNFSKYANSIIGALLERTKEKKKSVLDLLNSVLDLSFKYGNFHDIIEHSIEYMTHIVPLVKIETMQFLIRCLKETDVAPDKHDIESIIMPAIKLLQDSQPSVRNAASEVIGVLLKLSSTDQSRKYLEMVDKRHVKKVEQIRNSAVVKAPVKDRSTPAAQIEREQIPDLKHNATSSRMKVDERQHALSPNRSSRPSIPSKRAATSPLKENISNYKNALTSRSLKATNNTSGYGLSTPQLQELETLKTERLEWLEMKRELLSELELVKNNNESLLKEVMALNGKLDDYNNKFTTMSMTLKSKDTQIFRLRSDLESTQSKNSQLNQKMRLLENQLEASSKGNAKIEAAKKSPDESDINRRISILSIDSNTETSTDESKAPTFNSSAIYNFDSNDDSWKRATAVTNDLKAKIQRMKARTRMLDPTDD